MATGTEIPSRPIAICGMACRLPCGIKTPRELWDFLLAGGDARSEVPKSRYNIKAFYNPTGKPGTTNSQYGYFLEEDLANLDTSFFSMPRKEVERMDPQQRLMLEVARECLEDSGESGWRGKRIGCYVGNLGDDWLEMHAQDAQNSGGYRLSGYGDFLLSNRISYELDLKGPSMTIRTACSASMVALHEACGAISRRDCKAAIVGGVNVIIRPNCTAMMAEQGVLSPDGSCKTFSAAANGYSRGEAAVGIFVKPLEDAIRDGNSIRSIIRATATNHDGKTAGFTLPNPDMQETLIRRAYQVAGLRVIDTGYFECHGTGTAVGDPIETLAVGRVFGDVGVTIGSIKPNFGHTEGASGILSIIKAVLALENAIIPPSIKFHPKNTKIPWDSGKLILVEEPTEWPKGRSKRVSVNSFGLGGTNAHAIIDSAEGYRTTCTSPRTDGQSTELLLFSANTQQSLKTLVGNYKSFIENTAPDLANVAYTLARGREHLPYRTFAIATSGFVGLTSPPTKPSHQKPRVAMVFTGQGAQWPQMCSHLLKSNPVFQSTIRFLDRYLQETLGGSGEVPPWSLEEELLRPKSQSHIHEAEFSQPLCTAIQIGLVNVLHAVGISTDAVVGHSSGEIAGAYAAGALTAGDAIIVAWYRGSIVGKQERRGAMAALSTGVEEAESFLVPGTNIACHNSPRSITISGDTDKVDEVLAAVRTATPNVIATKLQVDRAYHSYHMAEVGEIYGTTIEPKIGAENLQRPFFSSVESGLLDQSSPLNANYWRKNLESPVLFHGAVACLLDHFSNQSLVLLEIGPHSTLAGPITQILSEIPHNNVRYVPTIVRNQNARENLLSAIGKLFTFNIPINFTTLFPCGYCLSDLPRYPFDYTNDCHWSESRLSKDFRRRKYPHHDLLGARTMESTDLEPAWRNMLRVEYSSHWLRDHKIGGNIVFPFAGFVAMAGEALRQVTQVEDAFRLRYISVETALLLSEEKSTEVVTTLRPLRLTLSQDSSWFEFTISAHNGSKWTKHCSGEVKSEQVSLCRGYSPTPFPRVVALKSWYAGLCREGMDLGYHFQNLDHVTASTKTYESRGSVSSMKHPTNLHSMYHLHPAVIDSALQLHSVAASNGLTRKHRNFLPTYCAYMFVARTDKDFTMNVKVNNMGDGSTSAREIEGQGLVHENLVLQVNGLKLTPASITDDRLRSADLHAAARLTWAPDLDFADTKTLFQPSQEHQRYATALGELSELSILKIQEQIINVDTQRPHLKKYAQWVASHAKLSKSPSCDSGKLFELCEKLSTTPAAPVAAALEAVVSNIGSLFRNEVTSWESFTSADNVGSLYEYIREFDSTRFLKTLGHSKPSLRLLEVGIWARQPSITMLRSLTFSDGQRLWSRYTFAHKATIVPEEHLVDIPNLEYVAFDINDDPLNQILRDREYDIIVVTNALHGISNLARTLQNLHKLLAPSGRLLIEELGSTSKWVNAILGTTPSWWYRSANSCADEENVSLSRLRAELKTAGFVAPDVVSIDPGRESQSACIMVARSPHCPSSKVSTPVYLLVKDEFQSYGVVKEALEQQGYEVNIITLKDIPQPNIDIMAIVDLRGPFFENIADEDFYDFQKFITSLKSSGILWVTRSCHIRVQDPRYAQVIGLARVIRSELLVDFATCEVDNDDSLSLLTRVFEKFRSRDDRDTLRPDFEYAIENGTINIGRYFPFNLRNCSVERIEGDRMKVAIGTPGRLDTLHWIYQSEPAYLKNHEIEIEMHAVGINFKDVLIALNLVGNTGRYHGLEGAGVVRRVAPNVRNFKPGDRVVAMEHNMLSTLLIANEAFCVKIPDSLSFMDAATMAVPYSTVLLALVAVGELKAGQSLLIHSACGGVGLAAIQIAQLLKVNIFATVGSEEKVEYLVGNCGIPRHRIFSSRDNGFVQGVYCETNGKGVDRVLNSLSGELLHESWKCVAAHGRLIEIGRRELLGHGRLDMEPFLANRSYCGVDLDAFFDLKSSRFKELLTEMVDYLERGLIKPIVLAQTFDASSVTAALRYMLPGTHIGRVGIQVRDANGRPTLKGEALQPTRKLRLDSTGYYLLAGGFGGLGRAISTYMVESGARHLVYFSRNAGLSSADRAFIGELESMCVDVVTVRGDINDPDDVYRAVAVTHGSLKGIIQLSNVQADENFAKLTKEQWAYSVGPKVTGTWNLHQATTGIALDFFVLSSSLSCVIGLPGQASYASGNSFLDAFVQYRNNLGLVCSAVDIGPVADTGILANKGTQAQTAALVGYKMLQEQEMLDAIAWAMMADIPQKYKPASTFSDSNLFVLGLESTTPLTDRANRVVWKRDRRMAIYHNDGVSTLEVVSASEQLQAYIRSAWADPAILKTSQAADYFAEEIGKHLFHLLLKDETGLNTALSLADLGLDSLVAIELRSWWRQTFGFDTSVLEMLSMGDLRTLGQHVSENLLRIIGEEKRQE